MIDSRRPVVVGLGRGRNGFPELDWAAAEAHLRGVVLRVIRSYELREGPQSWATSMDRMIIEDLRRDAERHLVRALDHIRTRWPDLPVQCLAVAGPAARVLTADARRAQLTVVGRHPQGRAAALFTSVPRVLAARATGPVVAVGPAPCERASLPKVCVGIGSLGDLDEIMSFAFGYARTHRRPLHAFLCRRSAADRGSPDASLTAELCGLLDALAAWRIGYPEVTVRADVVGQDAVRGLVSASAGHDLLVIGARTRHARIGALTGSVSQGVLTRARCPVAVVHPSARNGAPRAGNAASGQGRSRGGSG